LKPLSRLFTTSLLAIALVGGSIALAPPALGQPKTASKAPPSDKERRDAKRLFNKAHLAYRRGDYEEAILKWEQSFELSQEPLIYLSIANAYERLGDSKATLDYLKKWREQAPKHEHKELDGRIERLEQRVSDDEAKAAREKEEAARRAAAEDARRKAAIDNERRRLDQEGSSGDQEMWQIVGWSAIGVGGGAIVAGVIMDAVAAGARPDEAEACSDVDGQLLCRDDLRGDIESSNTLAIAGDITWIAGAAVAAGGVAVLLLLGYGGEDGDDSALGITPLVGPSGGGLIVGARF
jgi:tetratricopeptide (TPR) repeat protein